MFLHCAHATRLDSGAPRAWVYTLWLRLIFLLCAHATRLIFGRAACGEDAPHIMRNTVPIPNTQYRLTIVFTVPRLCCRGVGLHCAHATRPNADAPRAVPTVQILEQRGLGLANAPHAPSNDLAQIYKTNMNY